MAKTEVKLGIILLLFILLLLALLSITFHQFKKVKEKASLYEASQDTLKLVRNELNQQTASLEVLTTENIKTFTTLKTKENDIIELQKIIKQYKKENGDLSTAMILKNETIVKLQDVIRNSIIGYTADINVPNVSYPIYERRFNRTWDSGIMVMGLDTTFLDIKSRNEYNVTIGNEKVSLFKKKMFANITNLNPNTETKTMKVYQKEEVKTNVPKVLGIGTIIGILITKILL